MAKLRNPALETTAVVLAITVALSERFVIPLLLFGLRGLESFVQSLESEKLPLPVLQVKQTDYELVDVVQEATAVESLKTF